MNGLIRRGFSKLDQFFSGVSRKSSHRPSATGELRKTTSAKAPRFNKILYEKAETVAKIGHWELEIATDTIIWCPRIDQIFGLEENAYDGTYETFLSFVHQDDRERLRDEVIVSRTEDKPLNTKYRIIRPDGVERVISTVAVGRVESKDDAAVSLVGIVQDITERREAEEVLRLNAQIMNNMTEGVILTRMEDEVIVYANSRFEKVFGYSPGELIGQHVSILNASSKRPPEETAKEIIQAATEQGYWSGEIHNVKKDGTEFWSHTNITTFEHLQYGKVWLTVQQDITERIRTTQALRESEERLRNILDSMFGFVGLYTIEGVLIEANRASLEAAGLAREDVIGKPFWETYWWSYSKEVQEQLRNALRRAAHGETVRYDVPVRVGESQSGEPELVTIDVTFGPLCDTSGKVVQLVGSGVDITDRVRAEEERVRLEEQMQQTQKLESLGVLAGGIAHDFNNLLAAILGNADLALKELSPTSHARSYVNDIIASSERAADLSRQMLAYSGRGTFVLEPLNFNAIVQEMGQLLKPSIGKKVSLEYDLMRDLPQVEGDATQISQIVMNLVINASEAIGEDPGTISISTGVRDCESDFLASTWLDDSLPSGEYVYFEFTDTGCGMNSEDLEKIFDPFFTTKFTGRGLGLAAVLGIVRGHRGAVNVESMPGEGTRFTVFLPSLGTSETLVDTKLSESPSTQQQGTVLLVDDEPFVRKTTSSMLRKAGYSVLTAADGHEALKVYKEHSSSIICILLDLTMPQMDGEETFDELRQLGCHLPILLCSGFDSEETAERFNGKDVAGFLHKPYRMKELLGKLSATLDT